MCSSILGQAKFLSWPAYFTLRFGSIEYACDVLHQLLHQKFMGKCLATGKSIMPIYLLVNNLILKKLSLFGSISYSQQAVG